MARASSRRVFPSMMSRIFIAERCSSLQQAEPLAFLKQRFAADAQDFGGAADFVVRGIERDFNRIALEIFERAQRAAGALTAAAAGAHNFREILGAELRLFCEYQRVFHGVLKFANIARPIVGFQEAQRGGIEHGIGTAVHWAEALQKMRRQFRYVGAAFAQWRDDDRKHVQAKEKILAETSGGHCLG